MAHSFALDYGSVSTPPKVSGIDPDHYKKQDCNAKSFEANSSDCRKPLN